MWLFLFFYFLRFFIQNGAGYSVRYLVIGSFGIGTVGLELGIVKIAEGFLKNYVILYVFAIAGIFLLFAFL